MCAGGLFQKINDTVYKICVKQSWALRVKDINTLKATEMRMLQTMCGKILKDEIGNKWIQKIAGGRSIREALRSQ